MCLPCEHNVLSAQGPITATLLYLLKSKGRIPLGFSISTIDSLALEV